MDHVRHQRPSPVKKLIDKTDRGFDSITLQILLREQYEQDYQIFDHQGLGATRPMALVAYQPKEDCTTYSSLYRTIYRYKHHGIHSQFGLNLEEFLSLPRDVIEMLFRISTIETLKRNSDVDKAVDAMSREYGDQ